MRDEIIKKIYFTIIYFNVLKRPPSTFEVWRFFIDFSKRKTECSYEDVVKILDKLQQKHKILNEDGFWVLPEKRSLSGERVLRQKVSVSKIKKAVFWIKLINLVPYCRGIFSSGALTLGNSGKNSDWDILVVLRKNRIWLGRFFVTAFLFFLGKRRNSKKVKNRFCLNHFITENNLIFADRSEFAALDKSFMTPFIGRDYFDKMHQLNFAWSRLSMPNFSRDVFGYDYFNCQNKFLMLIKNKIERALEFLKVGDLLNNFCKEMMIKKIEKNPETYREGAFIVYNEGELAFWPKPKKTEILLKIRDQFS
jgi:predicted nucleotidyltransferase